MKQESAVTCDHFITGRGMGCSIDFALAIISRLEGKEMADKIAAQVVYSR